MSLHHAFAATLLTLGVLVELICVAGVVAMRSPADRIHYLGPASFLGPLLIALALIVDKSSLESCIKGVLIWLGLTVMGPMTTHAIGRAAIAESGDPDQVLERTA